MATTVVKAKTLNALVEADTVTFRESVRGRTKFYQYSTPLTLCAAGPGVVTSARITIEESSHFFASEITGAALLTASLLTMSFGAAGQQQPRIQLTDEGAGITVFDQALLWDSVVGTGQQPFRLQPPYLLRSKATVRVDFTNMHTAQVSLQLTLGGTKVFLG